MFAWGTPKENRKNEGKETLIDASRIVLLMFGFLGFWVPLFCFCYLVLWLFLNTNQRRRWDAKKKIDRTFQNSSAIHLPHNVRVTCEAHPAWAGWRDCCSWSGIFTLCSPSFPYLNECSLWNPVDKTQESCQKRESGSRGCSAQKPIFDSIVL